MFTGCDYDPTLALHCLAVPLGSREVGCPIIKQRTDMMKPDPSCEGRTPLDDLAGKLDETIDLLMAKPKKKEAARLQGQARALCYSIAVIRNPYHPDEEKEADAAMERWETRQED
jgi:hypothetical protein